MLQVFATYRGTVLDAAVLRASQSRYGGRWMGVVGLGLVLLGSAGFLAQTLGRETDWSTYERAVALGKVPAEAPAPSWGVWVLVAVAVGLVLLALTWIRTHEQDERVYTIGEGASASFATPPVDLISPEGFALAGVNTNGTPWLRVTPSMSGQVTVGGRTRPLQAWVNHANGLRDEQASTLALPLGAMAEVHHGALVFHVVPSDQESRPDSWRGSMAWAGGASVLGLLLLLALTEFASLAERATASTSLASAEQGPRLVYPARVAAAPTPSERSGPPAAAEPLTPTVHEPTNVERTAKHVPSRGVRRWGRGRAAQPTPRWPGLGRLEDAGGVMQRGADPIADAAGGLSIMAEASKAVTTGPYANAFSPDTDDREMWEAMKASDVSTKSVAGLSLVGKGRGGGPSSTDDMAGLQDVPHVAHRPLTLRVLLKLLRGSVRGPLVWSKVESPLRQQVQGLARCHSRPLRFEESFAVTFDIDARGRVSGLSVSGANRKVQRCLARAARGWRFEASGGASAVSARLAFTRVRR